MRVRGISNYNETAVFSETSRKLPAGAYEIKIIRAEEQNDTLCILFDIAGGELKDYYLDKFNDDKKFNPDNAKFKGVYRLWYETEGNSDELNERNRKSMKTALERIKSSNNLNIDFSREWDGARLKGCRVGMIFRDEEYDFNGHKGFSARPYSIITLDSFRKGNYTLPQAKTLSGVPAANVSAPEMVQTPLDDDLPF